MVNLPALPLTIPAASKLASVMLDKPTTQPNVFRKRIRQIVGAPKRGDWVAVYHLLDESAPELFAYGLYNPKSEIALRIVRWSSDVPDEGFWDQLLDRAVSLRRDILKLDGHTDCYRLLHAEADGFPGLVIDRYGDVLSAEVFSLAMGARAVAILERLQARLGTRHWLVQPSPQLTSQEGSVFEAWGSPELPAYVTVTENGTRYRVHFGTGHKTGFFCDQRENRAQLAHWCEGKTVLDICCYTGGFAVMAARQGKAAEVTGIDLDEAPLKLAKQNAALNDVRVKFTQAEAFAYMRDMVRGGKVFDIVVLDPPKLIRSRVEIDEGTKKHYDLNRLAVQLVKPGGLLLTCSCAGLLEEAEFLRQIHNAARHVDRNVESMPTAGDESATSQPAFRSNPGRTLQILARTAASADHPTVAHCPETDYLKAVWLRVW